MEKYLPHDGKRKKPSYSRQFDTPILSGGFSEPSLFACTIYRLICRNTATVEGVIVRVLFAFPMLTQSTSSKKSLVSFTGKHDPKSALPFHVIQHNNSHPWCASFPLRKSGAFCCRSFGNNSVVYRCRSPPPFDLPVNHL